jgi:hypothetical protein
VTLPAALRERFGDVGPLPSSQTPAVTPWTVVAGLCSLSAGAVHAAAAGAHGEHRAAVAAFTLLAVAQLVWGGVALVRGGRAVAATGVLVSAGAVGGWLLAKTTGVPLVAGLDVAEPVQLADSLAAALALTAGLLAALGLRQQAGPSGLRLPLGTAVVAVVAAGALAVATIGTHEHPAGGPAHDHDDTAAGARVVGSPGGDAHPHEDAADDHPEPVPYDPALPIDLGGTPGVTPAQQAEAENLVAITLSRLPQWADAAVAEAAGFRTIGDGFTGHEHLVNEAFLDDDVVLDPDRPESLVYDTSGGGRRLVAAMYMLQRGTPLEDVPDFGGALVQWHTHEDLCYSPSGYVQGVTDAAGNCPPGQVKPVPTPMVHVWIEPHRCGPFAALEGVAGGRIPDGETRLCDHAHGSAG